MFSNVAHFTLDLSNNKLEKMEAEVLYENGQTWEQIGTGVLKGYSFNNFKLSLSNTLKKKKFNLEHFLPRFEDCWDSNKSQGDFGPILKMLHYIWIHSWRFSTRLQFW